MNVSHSLEYTLKPFTSVPAISMTAKSGVNVTPFCSRRCRLRYRSCDGPSSEPTKRLEVTMWHGLAELRRNSAVAVAWW